MHSWNRELNHNQIYSGPGTTKMRNLPFLADLKFLFYLKIPEVCTFFKELCMFFKGDYSLLQNKCLKFVLFTCSSGICNNGSIKWWDFHIKTMNKTKTQRLRVCTRELKLHVGISGLRHIYVDWKWHSSFALCL